MPNEESPNVAQPAPTPKRRKYTPAVGPKLRVVLVIVFLLTALLGANGVYLASITFLEWANPGRIYQNFFYIVMFAVHIALGLLLVVPLVGFGLVHMFNARHRPNKRAARVGYGLFGVALGVLVTGLLLTRFIFDLRSPAMRSAMYWAHLTLPLVAVWLYWLHRLAGPRIKWKVAWYYGLTVAAICAVMVGLHSQDPRNWRDSQPFDERFLQPSLAQTATGEPIPADTLMMDHYCLTCHADIHAAWSESVHRFSSFNNMPYLASVRETRKFSMERDGDVRRSRFCAGCHDPVPLFSGSFDDPKFDDVNHPTAHAGITCTVCHAIVSVNSPRGNADYTIEEPIHYPFARSDNAVLQWVNNQLIKAKPSFHKKTFLKPLHKSAEFCGTCHKVHLPEELNDYKWLRGQNHYDPFLLSGVSGVGTRSFYYPPKAQANCNGCHMPLQASNDFGAQDFDDSGELRVHDHLFPTANTGIAHLRGKPEIVKAHQKFLEGVMRVDIFGVREGDAIDGKLHAPLRPHVPALKPGQMYLLESVIRTMKMGHVFTQGTADSNEIWLDVTVTAGDEVIGRSGAIDEKGEVDAWSHFVNAFVIDRHGNRIDRRNAQDIFIALYNHQIPPGAGQAVHYKFRVPENIDAPITVDVKLKYRKFDWQYMQFVTKAVGMRDENEPYYNDLPITVLAHDRVTFPIEGLSTVANPGESDIPVWQRWNDYGIGLLLKGGAQLRQAREAFQQVEAQDVYHGPLNLARLHFNEGDLQAAVNAIARATDAQRFGENVAPPWTVAWLSGMINRQQGDLDTAIENFRAALSMRDEKRGFDFSKDYVVINELGLTLFERAKKTASDDERDALLKETVEAYQSTLAIDPENAAAHYGLYQAYKQLGDEDKAEQHAALHGKYRPDDNARDAAIAAARLKYPAANHAAEPTAVYDLQREGAVGLVGVE